MISLNLDELRQKPDLPDQKTLFQHQVDALAALNKTFDFKDDQSKGALLVFPTGAGKTFTTVKWLLEAVVSKNIKVLWLAHTFHLLDQACDTRTGPKKLDSDISDKLL